MDLKGEAEQSKQEVPRSKETGMSQTLQTGDLRTQKWQDGRDRLEEVSARWEERSRIVLTPISAPSVVGLFGFAAATTIVAGNLAGWYGTTKSALYFAPFALAFGGIAQFMAGMWAFKARDTLATAMHTMWGSFWIAYGIFWLLAGTGAIAVPPGSSTYFPGFGMWFVMLGLLTGIGALVSIAKNMGLFATLGLLSAGSCLLAAAFLSGSLATQRAGGWVLVASAGAAIYTATALLCAETYGRTILPLGKFTKAANIPGAVVARPIEYPYGMPGSRVGQ
jgi:succinate-acetate transporter protein